MGSAIALTLVALLVAASIKALLPNRKKGSGGCTGCCACCSGCSGSCHSSACGSSAK
ncbi:MAG: FeoB-associated Cys-rich membrane protein [Lachnospiraceae bacterium]|nr:FeoB-associated Cys-rich membrane protein [Lachnospiraceae bacterium]